MTVRSMMTACDGSPADDGDGEDGEGPEAERSSCCGLRLRRWAWTMRLAAVCEQAAVDGFFDAGPDAAGDGR